MHGRRVPADAASRRLCRSGSRRRLQVRRQGPRSVQRWERREACAAGRLGCGNSARCGGQVQAKPRTRHHTGQQATRWPLAATWATAAWAYRRCWPGCPAPPMPVTVELRDRLAPWTKQLGWHRPSPAEAAAAVVRRHGWAWKRSCGTISADFGDEILIIFSIRFSTATYNLEYNIDSCRLYIDHIV